MEDKKSILIFDLECDSLDTSTAKLKWFGAYSYLTGKYYLLDYKKNVQIRDLIKSHKVLVGFNNRSFDQPIIQNFFNDSDLFKYKIIIDLYEVSAPKGMSERTKNNKGKLPQINIKLKNYTLRNIINALKLDEDSKGDIDYKIFRKDEWTESEIKEIEKYLKQDIEITKKLFDWYDETFTPLKKYLSNEDVLKCNHIRTSFSSLGYTIMCNMSGREVKWEEYKPEIRKSFFGGHHIENRWELVKGNIIEIDFSSAYPHAMIMGNLFSSVSEGEGWDGDDYYSLKGTYNNSKQGKVEEALHNLMLDRLKAKKENDKAKNLSYKLIINSIYGLTGSYKFKSLYNPVAASDCTSIVRTWMKKLSKYLEEQGFLCLYGFTDSIFLKLEEESDKTRLMNAVNAFIKEALSNIPFPKETFLMDIEEEIKMIWFVKKNCYLFVTKDDKIKYKSTLLNQNTPKVVMKLFKEYMTPKIIKELDIKFSQGELEKELIRIFENDPQLACEEYKVGEIDSYNVKTSLQYQISEAYGEGRHFLIPNRKGIGVGKAKGRKGKPGLRYCTYEEYVENNLRVKDIDTTQLMNHLKEFLREQQNLLSYIR